MDFTSQVGGTSGQIAIHLSHLLLGNLEPLRVCSRLGPKLLGSNPIPFLYLPAGTIAILGRRFGVVAVGV